MTDGIGPGRGPGKEQRAKSPDRRARLAQALKANIARRKAGAQAAVAQAGKSAETAGGSTACDDPPLPAENPADDLPVEPAKR